MRPWKPFLKRLAMMLFSLGLTLALLEVAMRFVGRPPDSIKQTPLYDRSRYYFASDMERLQPYIRDTNHMLRIAIVGDSFTNGQGVQPDDTFGMRLERLLNLKKDALPAAVGIYAKGGTSTYMQMGFFEQALSMHPDVLIVAVYLNDTEDFTRYDELKAWRSEMMPAPPPRWLGWLAQHSVALAWFYRKTGDIKSGRGFLRYHERLYADDYSGWKRFKKTIRGFHSVCKELDIPLVIAVWPCLSVLDRDPYPFQFAHDKIAQFLKEEGIRHLDWLDSLRGLAPVRMEVLPGTDGHPSEIAHRIAAEALFHYLLNEGLVDASYIPRNEAVQYSDYWEAMFQRMRKPEKAGGEAEPQAPTR